MSDIVFEIIKLFIFTAIFLVLLWGVRLTKYVQLRGRRLLIAGTILVIGSAAMDVLDEFQAHETFLSVFSSSTFHLLEEIGGILGFSLLALGLLLMMHSVFVALSAKKNIDLKDERYRLIVENIYDIIFLVDLNFNWIYITPSVEKFRGYTVEEALHQNIKDVLTRKSARWVRRIVRQEILGDKKPGVDPRRMRTLELEFYHKDGSTVWGEVTATFLRDEGGHIIGIQGVNRDITNRKKAQQAIRESEERFRKTFMLSPLAATVNRIEDGRFVMFNKMFLEQTGFSEEEVKDKTAVELSLWAEMDERDQFREILLKNGMVSNFEAHVRTKSGEVGVGLFTATIINLDGIAHMLTIIKDVTEAKRYQQALAKSEARLRSTLEAIGDSVRIIDMDNIVTWANDIAVSQFGPMVGHKCFEVIQDLNRQCDDCNTQKTFRDGNIRTREIQVKNDQGNKYYLATCAPVRENHGEITSIVETFKDITGLKEVEERLLKSINEKESLIKEVHHRVKNNLQAISGLLNIQAIRLGDPQWQSVIRESQNRILSIAMVHEHLYSHHNLSKIDFTGYARILVKNIQSSFDLSETPVAIEVTGQTLILNTDTAIPCGLILTELVSNCFKHAFTPGQEAKIKVETEYLGDGRCVLIVRDNGKGLPDDFSIDTIDSFGMTLVRTFAGLLDGDLSFERGEETVFKVVFHEYEEAKELVFN